MTNKTSKKYYYHLAPFTGWLAINEDGIKASKDGYIYMFDTDDPKVFAYAARNQLFMEDYGIFRIDPDGINVPLEPDEVAELTAKHQFRAKQARIDKKYIKDLGMKKVIP